MIELGHSTDYSTKQHFTAPNGLDGDLIVMASNVGGNYFIIGSTKDGISTDSSWKCIDMSFKDTNPEKWHNAVELVGPGHGWLVDSDEFDKFSNCSVENRPCAKPIWAESNEFGDPPNDIVCIKQQAIPKRRLEKITILNVILIFSSGTLRYRSLYIGGVLV